MFALAVVRLRGESLEVLTGQGDEFAHELVSTGLRRRSDGCWEGPARLLEPVCSLLDGLGVAWGLYDPGSARTFGERLFAECPDELAPDLYQALRSTLVQDPSAELHVAVLDAAWLSRGTSTGYERDISTR